MKKIATLVTLLITFWSFAQNFQGMAVYESKTSTEEMMKNMPNNRDITPEMRERFKERIKKAFEKTFVLNFDRTSSIYKEEEKLETPGQGSGMRFGGFGGDGTLYKNIKEKRYASDKEMFGKEFLIQDSLKTYNWVMESETRKIGNYTCFKATVVVPIDDSDFRNMRFRNRNKDKETEEKTETQKDSTKTTNFFESIEIPKEKTITAWYTPEIPVNQGPDEYWGLPGLILEVNDGRTTILCSKIVLNPKEQVAIKEPTKGKKVSEKEFNETIMKKMEEMRKQFQNNRGGRRMGPPR